MCYFWFLNSRPFLAVVKACSSKMCNKQNCCGFLSRYMFFKIRCSYLLLTPSLKSITKFLRHDQWRSPFFFKLAVWACNVSKNRTPSGCLLHILRKIASGFFIFRSIFRFQKLALHKKKVFLFKISSVHVKKSKVLVLIYLYPFFILSIYLYLYTIDSIILFFLMEK